MFRALMATLMLCCSESFRPILSPPKLTKLLPQRRHHRVNKSLCYAVPTSWSCTASIKDESSSQDIDYVREAAVQTQINEL
eukprot:15333074-Ditylum_brightwellii.AAC.1